MNNEPKPQVGVVHAFAPRHIGPRDADLAAMLATLGVGSLDELTDETVPADIRLNKPLNLPEPRGEREVLEALRETASKNRVLKSFIGMGYHGTVVPPVIQRNILENPGWYTQYTPYQAEIAQGRLEALMNFQTMVADLTALPLANASLLDEATAAAEAMAMCRALVDDATKPAFFVASDCHPQTIAVVRTRAHSLGIPLVVAPVAELPSDASKFFGVLLQYPATDGRVVDYTDTIARVHKAGGLTVVATDLLPLTLLKPPGEMGADIAVGNSQRFGVSMGYGGPHAAFMATKPEYVRKMPGRLVGLSKDSHGKPAYRLTLQTREQHIRREKATSNICTAQVLLAIMAGMYAVYHGPEGLRQIAKRVRSRAVQLGAVLMFLKHKVNETPFFDTIRVRLNTDLAQEAVLSVATEHGFNLRAYDDGSIGVSVDETTTPEDVDRIAKAFRPPPTVDLSNQNPIERTASFFYEKHLEVPPELSRSSAFCTHPVFNTHHSETDLLRYIFTLQSRDLSLAHSMIPLGSCTMKLNATSEMLPVTWPEFGQLHPYAPAEQAKGYAAMLRELERWLAEITGFAAVSLQPNAGSQGEYAGLLAIRGYHHHRNEKHRDICLIPTSAHGTNPASAVIAGFKVVAVACDAGGNVDVADLKKKAATHAANLGALMITYPSTHGVFETSIKQICEIVHRHGGQVYMDGANMNAQVGLCRPGDIGADVCHLNLHKTFCIPHGGGGPGMGPIGVAKHLVPFLPGDPLARENAHGAGTVGFGGVGPVSAANYGSASILPISYVYIAMMGGSGLKKATQVAILNANYMAKQLDGHYPILFRGPNGRCAHEFILDCRAFERTAGVKVEDIAKRLIDYGFHAPTMSWPVPGTLMVEPTESESKAELDRFCDAMIAIRQEIAALEAGKGDKADNALKHAPHTAAAVAADEWPHAYSRQQAAYPLPGVRDHKFWPHVGRVDNPFGDRNLVCTCPPMDEQV